jgi:hypothetical protein
MALWFTLKWHESYKIKSIILLGIVCGLAILSRPTEIVILIIPALWNIFSWKSLKAKINVLRTHFGQIILFGSIVFLMGFLQLIYWKIHTGQFLFYSYSANPGEGLELLSPFITKFLFSFRKGWIIYTPIMIFAFAGFYFLYKNNRKIFLPLLAYTLLNLYLVSSWSTWWYANSFSQRPMVPALATMIIPLGCFLQYMLQQKTLLKVSLSVVIVFLVFLNIFQIWQFNSGIIDGERMTKEYYEKIFLKSSVDPEDEKLLLINRGYCNEMGFYNEQEYVGKHLKTEGFENGGLIDSIAPAKGSRYCILDSSSIYSQAIEMSYADITNNDHAWLRVHVRVFPVTAPDSMKFALVLHFIHNGLPYQYKTLESSALKLKQNEWNEIRMDYLTPEVRHTSDVFKTYVWNMSGGFMLVDELSLEAFEEKNRTR